MRRGLLNPLRIDPCGCRRRLTISSQVRHDAKQALDHRELRPMMHFVFFRPKQHFKAALRSATSHAHVLSQRCLRKRLQPSTPAFPFSAQELNDLVLSTGTLLLHLGLPDELSEVEALERRFLMEKTGGLR